jgi:hypothetical protein
MGKVGVVLVERNTERGIIPKQYEELPGTILTNLLAKEFEKGDGSWYEPNMAQHEEGGKWGLGQIDREMRDAARIPREL